MTINVRELLKLNKLNSIKIISGRTGLDKPVEYVNVMDTKSIENWLKGKELLLVCGVFKSEPNLHENIVKIAAEKNVTAIGTKFETCFGRVPIEMIEQSDKYSIPLLDIPSKFSWIDIMVPVYDAIASKKTKSIEKHEFLFDLIYGNITSRKQIIEQGQKHKINLSPSFITTIFSINQQQNNISNSLNDTKYIENKLKLMDNIKFFMHNLFPNCVVFRKEQNLIILIPENKITLPYEDAMKNRINEALIKISYDDELLKVFVGVSNKHAIENICKGYNEALKSIELSSIINNNKSVIFYEDLGLYRILSSRKNDNDTQIFYSKTIKPLVLYDKENKTQYVRALEAFLEYGISEGAKMLYIHPNTLRYQLKKIEEITNKSLDNYDDKLELQIGLKLEKLFNK